MHSSDKQSQIEQASQNIVLPFILPKSPSGVSTNPRSGTKLNALLEREKKPQGSHAYPIVVHGVFPLSAFIGPIPFKTAGEDSLSITNRRQQTKAPTFADIMSDRAGLTAGVAPVHLTSETSNACCTVD